MTLWARLTWQAKDPAATAGELSRRLSVAVVLGGAIGTKQLGEGDRDRLAKDYLSTIKGTPITAKGGVS